MKRVSLIFVLFILFSCSLFVQAQYIPADGENWLSGWTHRARYNITGATGAGTDYQVYLNVSYVATMQTDFDDLRVTDNDGDTLLDAWLQNKTDSTWAEIWIQVQDSLETDSAIYLYWGNSTVSDYWDGPATFLLFDDFDDASYNTTLWNTVVGTEYEGGGELVFLGSSITIESDDTWSHGSAIGFHAAFWEVRAMGFGDDSPFDKEVYVDTFSGTGRLYCRTGSSTAIDSFTEDQATWQDIEVLWYNGSYASATVNGAVVASVSDALVPDANCHAYFRVYDPDTEYLTMKHVYIRKLADSTQPIITLDPVGWTEIGDALLYLTVLDPVLVWGLDVILVMAGLIAMPVSTIYLVTNRKDMNTDKLLIFLIMFMVGIGLFVGGIMP